MIAGRKGMYLKPVKKKKSVRKDLRTADHWTRRASNSDDYLFIELGC